MTAVTSPDHTTSRDQKQAFQTGGVLLISMGHFIHDVYSSFLAPLLPLLIDKLGLTLARAGLLTTVMQIPALLNPIIGTYADRISVRWLIILAPSLTAVPMSLIGAAPNYTVLLLLLLTAGISVSLFHVPAPVMVAKLSGGYKGRGMSFFMTGGELARSVGPLVAVAAVTLLGLEGFYPVMVFGLLASGWLFIRFKGVEIRSRHREPIPLAKTWRQLKHFMLPLIAILCARGFMNASITAFLPTYIRLDTGDLWLAGISLTLVEGAGVAGVLTAGAMSDALGRRRVLLLALIAAPLTLLGFVWLDGWLRFVALILTGFTLLSTTPVMLALVQEHSPTSPAAANGIFMMAVFTSRSSVVFIVGILGDIIGLQATYLCSALIGFAAIPFVMMLPSKSAP